MNKSYHEIHIGERQLSIGVIWNSVLCPAPVIPAKAGIHCVGNAFLKVREVDSRFCGNDCGLARASLANDAITDS
jgi:hypothetical protein